MPLSPQCRLTMFSHYPAFCLEDPTAVRDNKTSPNQGMCNGASHRNRVHGANGYSMETAGLQGPFLYTGIGVILGYKIY